MSDIPERVKQELRREVGYGCPICRSPFLTFHHFDPPRHVEQHNRPEGMIALCLDHHGDADAGNYSNGELRALKKKNYSFEDVKGRFPSWRKQSLLVRIGGVYTGTSTPIISINGVPQITLNKNEADLLCLSFEVRDREGNVVAKMVDNCFEVHPAKLHDMTVTPKTKDVKVWLAPQDVGLHLTFDRITTDALQAKLAKDEERRKASGLPDFEDSHPLSSASVTRRVIEWATRNCLADDGLIPFLDFQDIALNYRHNGRLEIKNGIAHVIHYGAEFENGVSAISINCHCPMCEPAGASGNTPQP
jgi:hypothetical protein